jgi:hypothetical protein
MQKAGVPSEAFAETKTNPVEQPKLTEIVFVVVPLGPDCEIVRVAAPWTAFKVTLVEKASFVHVAMTSLATADPETVTAPSLEVHTPDTVVVESLILEPSIGDVIEMLVEPVDLAEVKPSQPKSPPVEITKHQIETRSVRIRISIGLCRVPIELSASS